MTSLQGGNQGALPGRKLSQEVLCLVVYINISTGCPQKAFPLLTMINLKILDQNSQFRCFWNADYV